MPTLVWHKTEERSYEHGVDKGVIYVGERPGVVWNGLVYVNVNFIGGEKSQHYFDGVKYADIIESTTFQATVGAVSIPKELNICLGEWSIIPGFILTNQELNQINFSYRTLVGPNEHYKIHLIYNAEFIRTAKTYSTINETTTPSTMEWRINVVPPDNDRIKPTSHIVIDSKRIDPYALEILQDMLYGTDTTNPFMPTQGRLLSLIGGAYISIIDNFDGTWTFDGPIKHLNMIDETTFEINDVNAVYLDNDTYQVSNTDKSTD